MGQLSEALKGISIPSEAQTLVAEADRLLAEGFKQAQYIDYLESEIKRLKSEKGISGARDNLAFNTKTGTYVESPSGVHYCPKCLNKDKRHPLKDESYGWRCSVCDAYFPNPDAEPPTMQVELE